MSISVQQSPRYANVIVQSYHNAWTWSDFLACVQESSALIRSQDNLVHVISDFTKSSSLPLKGAIAQVKKSFQYIEPNTGLCVVVISQPSARLLISALELPAKIAGAEIKVTHSVEQAYSLIQQSQSKKMAG